MDVGKIYKIRNKRDGTYSSGSKNGYLTFTKNGKAFSQIGHSKSCLKQFFPITKYSGIQLNGVTESDLEIVEYETIVKDIIQVMDLFNSEK